MSLPVNASIQAAQSYLLNVRAAYEFLVRQDATRADARYAALLAQLKEARDLLRWNPASGRPARFLAARSGQGRASASRAKALAAAHGVPELRELVVKPHVLLYAHSADRVVLLALRHERQLVFQMPE
jgi:plasmid stabilization system protein ParE